MSSERHWFYFLLPITIVVLLVNVNWLRSAFGRAWIHHRDIAAESLGINVARYKLLSFSASTSLTCLAGALWAYHTGFVSAEAFDFNMLIHYLAMVIIGGLGSLLGAMLGAIFVTVFPHVIRRQTFAISILLIEQDASSALAIADYGYIMEGGRIVYEGTADKLRSHQDVQEFCLGSGDAGRASYRDVKQYRRSRRWWG